MTEQKRIYFSVGCCLNNKPERSYGYIELTGDANTPVTQLQMGDSESYKTVFDLAQGIVDNYRQKSKPKLNILNEAAVPKGIDSMISFEFKTKDHHLDRALNSREMEELYSHLRDILAK